MQPTMKSKNIHYNGTNRMVSPLLTILLPLSALCALAFAAPARAQEETLKDAPHIDLIAMNRAAVTRSLPLLQKGAAGFRDHVQGACFSCHHQSVPAMAYAAAREHGFVLDTKQAQEDTKLVKGMCDALQPALVKAQTNPSVEKELDEVLVDPPLSLAYALNGLAADGCKPDKATEAAAIFLMRKQAADGRWPVWTARPPLESSEFTATALAVRALQKYALQQSAEVTRRTTQARNWLLNARPKTTEDKAFRLCGLKWTGAPAKDIQAAADALIALQHDDGGWAQLPDGASDAYATGQALVALHQAGGMPTLDSVYRRGAFYLVATQQEDGSWRVAKRANPVQSPFDTHFPHDKDQFISMTASSWATFALALTVPAKSAATLAAATKPTTTR